MLPFENDPGARTGDPLTRRDFLRAGSLALGLGLGNVVFGQPLDAAEVSNGTACIQLFLVGGPSQLDTWDPKPDAPEEVRGPFRPLRTNVPGVTLSEHFPLMARRADRYALVRSVYHDEAPIHETGQQLLQTGRVFRAGREWSHCGAILSRLQPSPNPSWVVLPGPLGSTGVNVSHGQTAGFLGELCGPYYPRPSGEEGVAVREWSTRAFDLRAEPQQVRTRYGWSQFGQCCLLARRLVQHGVRFVTVNMFDTVFGQITWDCHANGSDLTTNLDDYRDTLCPTFDRAYTALLDDLQDLGLLSTTLVLATGEFGRTPKLNRRGGRDHWPAVWSAVLAGGGVRGGQVIGRSDQHGAEPRDRPVHAAELAATVYQCLGVDPAACLPGSEQQPQPLVPAEPVWELF